MKRMLAILFCLAFAGGLRADDWPQWRGPKRDGISLEKGLLKEWPKAGPTLAWSFKNAGLGFSSFAVRDGKLYTLGSRDDSEIILVLDATDGKELWTAKIGPIVTAPENTTYGDGPRATPTLDGNLLFALGSQSDLVCVDLSKNGAEIWHTNLEKDYGGKLMTGWGYSESPLVDGDNLFVSPGGEKGNFVLLEKKTGKLVWQCTDVKQTAAYSSAMPADFGGVHQFVQLSYVGGPKGAYVNGIEAKTGKLLWQAQIFKGDSYAAAPTPIITDKYVYVTTGYGGGCHLFEIKDGKATDKYSLGARKNVKNTHGGVVLIDGCIYGHSETTGWVCQDMLKGTLKWSEKNELATSSGSITSAEGMLYAYTDGGECALLKADPEEFKVISSFTIPQRSAFPKTRPTSLHAKAWSHPVISGGHLFLRNAELIFCYDIRAAK